MSLAFEDMGIARLSVNSRPLRPRLISRCEHSIPLRASPPNLQERHVS